MAGEFFGTSPEFDVRKRYALSLLQQGTDSSPVKHPLAALARALQGGIGGYLAGQAQQEDAAKGAEMFSSLPGLGGGQATPGPQASAAPVSMPQNGVSSPNNASLPRGIRNNNPLNIEAGNFTQGIPGYAGSDGRFARFETPDGGIQAANKLLDVYQNKHGLNTVAGIVGRWAPAGDGNNVSAYAANVSRQLGIGPNDPIPPEMRQQLIAAMGQHENGRPIQMASLSGGGGGGMSQSAPQALAQPQPQQPQPPQQMAQAQRSQTSIPPEVAQTIRKLGADPRTRAQAWQLYLQYAKPTEQWTQERGKDGSMYQRNAVTGKMEVLEKSDVLPPEAVQQKIDITRAGKPETTINNTVNPVLKGVGDRFNERMDQAQGSVTQIQAIHEARKALDQGAFTGMGAEPKLFFGKAAALFDIPSDKAVNTEVLRSAIGDQVLAKAKTLGANPSNADRDYIEKVVGGKIALEEGTMRKLLDMQEGWARAAIKRANADGEKLLKAQPKELESVAPLMRVEEPMTYQDFIKANPMAAPQQPAQAPQAAPKIQDGMTATNPQTGQKVIFRGGQWVPQ